jgi:hypothetical protein
MASWQPQKIPEDSQYRENVEQWFNFITKVTTEKDNVRDWCTISFTIFTADATSVSAYAILYTTQ